MSCVVSLCFTDQEYDLNQVPKKAVLIVGRDLNGSGSFDTQSASSQIKLYYILSTFIAII